MLLVKGRGSYSQTSFVGDDGSDVPRLDMGPEDDLDFAWISGIDDVPDDGIQLVCHAKADNSKVRERDAI